MSVLSITSPDLGSVFTARPDERLAVCRGNCGTAFIEKTFRSAPVIPINPCFREVDRVWSDYAETDQTYASPYQMFIKKKVKGLGRLLKKGIDALRIKMRCQSTETSPRAVEDILARLDPRFLSPVSSPKAIEDILAFLDPRFRSPLLSMYRNEPQLGTDGQLHPVRELSGVPPSVGMWIYNLCLSVRPKATIEIGMAFGFSTLYFLAAIAKCQAGRHTAIDPFQSSLSYGIGLRHAQAVAPTNHSDPVFRLIEDRSDRVATDLARSNCIFEIILIDGNHRFDDVLVDFYLYAPLCAIGGHIIFDDMWMSSIQTAVAFVRSNRSDFVEVRTAEPRICVFQRVGDDSREWTDFRKFAVAPVAS